MHYKLAKRKESVRRQQMYRARKCVERVAKKLKDAGVTEEELYRETQRFIRERRDRLKKENL